MSTAVIASHNAPRLTVLANTITVIAAAALTTFSLFGAWTVAGFFLDRNYAHLTAAYRTGVSAEVVGPVTGYQRDASGKTEAVAQLEVQLPDGTRTTIERPETWNTTLWLWHLTPNAPWSAAPAPEEPGTPAQVGLFALLAMLVVPGSLVLVYCVREVLDDAAAGLVVRHG